jgi:hypothetical protein
LRDWGPTRREWSFLAACFLLWLAAIATLPPSLGGTDVYLFRDAAYNWLAGQGFRTASFEHSSSFSPLLYSSYTPGTLWVFAAAAKLLGTGSAAAKWYPCLLALLAAAVVVVAGLRFLGSGWRRWAFLALLGLTLPFGPLGPIGERPETVSFLVLASLALALRRAPGVGAAAAAGLLGGAAFLCEPFAGVVAVLWIAGWLLFAEVPAVRRPGLGGFAARSAAAALLFLLPLALTAGAFYQRDPHSLQRFWRQATVAGVGRQANYHSGDLSADHSNAPGAGDGGAGQGNAVSPTRPNRLQKYRDALAFHRSLGPIHLFEMAASALIALAWALLLLAARGPWRGRLALLLAGFACFVLPVAVFPLQGNYLTLTRVLFPVLLAANWAWVRRSLRSEAAIPLLLTVNLVAVLPASGIAVLMGWESRASYTLALGQVETLREYLAAHPVQGKVGDKVAGKVVLVPPTHYFLYKQAVGDIYNPAYLSRQEDPAEVAAVANCYAATPNFAPGTLPLPEFVAGRQWRRLSTAQDAVAVSLLGHRLMSRNWGMGCDLYVAPDK